MSSTNKRMLIVEDEVIIALDLEDAMRAEHVVTIDMAHTLHAAQDLVERHNYDFAVLDLNLGLGEDSLALGIKLRAAGSRVIFTSGYRRSEAPELEGFPLIAKPFLTKEVSEALGLERDFATSKMKGES